MIDNVRYQSARRQKWQGVTFMAIACLVFVGPVYGKNSWQTQADLEMAAKTFLYQHFADRYELKIEFGNLDKRLRLARCKQKLRVFLPVNKQPVGSVSLGIRCTNPGWKVHLPTKVKAFTDVLVASRPIVKNSVIQLSDLQLVRQDIGRYYSGVFTNPENLVGMVAKRSIRHDTVITPRMVKPKRLVKRGDTITIIAESNGMSIRTTGEALMDGHHGQIIQVKNKRSGRQVSAEVIARLTVKVNL